MTGNSRNRSFGRSSDGGDVPASEAIGVESDLSGGQNSGPVNWCSSSSMAGMVAMISSRSSLAKRHVSAASFTIRLTAILIASSSLGAAKFLIALTISSTTVPAAVLIRCLAPLLVNAARSVC